KSFAKRSPSTLILILKSWLPSCVISRRAENRRPPKSCCAKGATHGEPVVHRCQHRHQMGDRRDGHAGGACAAEKCEADRSGFADFGVCQHPLEEGSAQGTS